LSDWLFDSLVMPRWAWILAAVLYVILYFEMFKVLRDRWMKRSKLREKDD